jgi:hypothetical protein
MLLAFTGAVAASKRGLSWPYYNENTSLDPSQFSANGKVTWMYNWETWRPANTAGVNFVGMQRCTDCESSPIGELGARASQQGWTDLFTLNEPDLNGISPGDAANWYMANINSIPTKKALPAVTSSTSGGQGLDWLSQFLSACGGNCSHDYINLHWYGSSIDDFKNHVSDAHSKFSEPIVITEFALTAPASADDQAAFFKDAVAWLDSQDYVVMYFPFVGSSASLFSANDGAGAGYVGTGSCLFNDDGSVSSAGQALLS